MHIELPGSGERIRPGKLVCVGRNYAKHAEEMKSEVLPEPMLFLKPSTALVASGGTVVIPPMTKDVHHEVELVVAIGRKASRVNLDDATTCIGGYAVGLDMTARDLQAEAKKGGRPWSVAKGFDTFAPIGEFVAPEDVPDPSALAIELRLNDRIVQSGSTKDMIFSPTFLVHYASHIFTLERGDLIYTGTPEGVGPVSDGDVLVATVAGLPRLTVSVSRYG
jgi:2-keto-4-pentenoate hydratase/2-oxohepta-3-ene-1,7-dioic acid hydratase in catechol pathway